MHILVVLCALVNDTVINPSTEDALTEKTLVFPFY